MGHDSGAVIRTVRTLRTVFWNPGDRLDPDSPDPADSVFRVRMPVSPQPVHPGPQGVARADQRAPFREAEARQPELAGG